MINLTKIWQESGENLVRIWRKTAKIEAKKDQRQETKTNKKSIKFNKVFIVLAVFKVIRSIIVFKSHPSHQNHQSHHVSRQKSSKLLKSSKSSNFMARHTYYYKSDNNSINSGQQDNKTTKAGPRRQRMLRCLKNNWV